MSTLLNILNDEQKSAVTYTKGHLLIIAGAGAGKTTVITTKIAYLIEQKMALPNEILALTFTDKAAGEMEERLDKLLPYGMFDRWISTFHSFCDRILRQHALDIGISPDYRLIDTTESWILLKKNLYTLQLDYYRPKGNPSKFIHALLKFFSRLKDESITKEEYLHYAEELLANPDTTMGDSASPIEATRIKETADAYFQYQQLLLDNNCLDFGDLIFYTNTLFVQRPQILKKYQDQFKYILIDEFQDTNRAQYNLIKLLFKNNMITVVGDDDQAIYKFRGASISNILNFKHDFRESKEIVLTQNYRSPQNILDTAYTFIRHNNPDRLEYQLNNPDAYYKEHAQIVKEKINKKLIAQGKEQGIISLIQASSIEDEISQVITKIKELLKNPGATYNDIAILVRANSAADPFTTALQAENIPYIFLSNTGLYKKSIIIDILSYARILYDHNNASCLTRVLGMPIFDIKENELISINFFAKKHALTLFDTLNNIRRIPRLQGETAQKIEKLLNLINEHRKKVKHISATEMLFLIINDTRYREYLVNLEQQQPQKAVESISYINELIKKIENYSRIYDDRSLKGFIDYIDLEREAGNLGMLNQNSEQQGPEAVKIMTIHGSKGLEFTYVFIPQLVEQRFPTITRSDPIDIPDDLLKNKEILPEGDSHLQEERRLFYVALTRAKKGIFVSFSLNYGGKRIKKPSSFLKEAELLKSEKNLTVEPKLIDTSLFNKSTTPENQAKELIYLIPKEFSYSQIAVFNICPLQYKYQFILRIPQDKGRHTFSFGRTMHNTLLHTFRRLQERSQNKALQGTLFDASASSDSAAPQNFITLDEIYSIYKQHWIDEWYESPESKKHYFEAGKKILREFYERYKNNWKAPLYLEKDFKIQIGGEIIKGRIDRIDKIADNNGKIEAEIIDYKTSAVKKTLTKEDKIQLLIYQIALEEQGINPVNLTYYYLHEDEQAATSFLGTREELEKTKQYLTETITEIKKSNFKAKPSDFTCKNCDFKDICPFSVA